MVAQLLNQSQNNPLVAVAIVVEDAAKSYILSYSKKDICIGECLFFFLVLLPFVWKRAQISKLLFKKCQAEPSSNKKLEIKG